MSYARLGLLLLLASQGGPPLQATCQSGTFSNSAGAPELGILRACSWVAAPAPTPGEMMAPHAAPAVPPDKNLISASDRMGGRAADRSFQPVADRAAPEAGAERLTHAGGRMPESAGSGSGAGLNGAVIALIFGAFGLLVIARRGRRNAR